MVSHLALLQCEAKEVDKSPEEDLRASDASSLTIAKQGVCEVKVFVAVDGHHTYTLLKTGASSIRGARLNIRISVTVMA